MENKIPDEEIIAFADKNVELLKSMNEEKTWVSNGDVKGTKLCKMFSMDVGKNIASRGVVEDVEGTL